MGRGEPDPCGIVHITIGDGGNREGLASRYVDRIVEVIVCLVDHNSETRGSKFGCK